MSVSKQGKTKNPVLRILQYGTTVLLILCTALCFFTVVRTAAKKEVSFFGYRLFYVVSGSMEPTIPVGSLLLVGKEDTYYPGEVITFYSKELGIEGYPNTHRVIDREEIEGKKFYITQGDANPVPDAPVSHEDVIGKVHFSIKASFYKDFINFFSTPAGFFTIILLPSLLVAVVCMKSMVKAIKEEAKSAALAAMTGEQGKKEECQEDETDTEDTIE